MPGGHGALGKGHIGKAAKHKVDDRTQPFLCGAHHEHPNYVKIWAILVVLLVISVLGPTLEIRVVTLITAFGIAIVKAYLVAVNFTEPKPRCSMSSPNMR